MVQKIEVVAAALINSDLFSVWLRNEATIMTTEGKAIQLAFEHITMLKDKHFIKLSDSLSC